MSSSLEFLSIGKHYAGPVLTRQVFGPERPSGADNQVTGHFEPVGFVKYSLEHIYPLVAQIIQRSDIQFVCRSRICNGIDFHAANTRLVKQVQLTYEFISFHLVAVPPPAYKWPVGVVRRRKVLEQSA